MTSFNDRMIERAEALIDQLGEAGTYYGNGFKIDDQIGIFQWSWVVDPVSGVTMERQMARVKMKSTDIAEIDIATGDEMEWRDTRFRVQGLLPNDGGVTVVELARVAT